MVRASVHLYGSGRAAARDSGPAAMVADNGKQFGTAGRNPPGPVPPETKN